MVDMWTTALERGIYTDGNTPGQDVRDTEPKWTEVRGGDDGDSVYRPSRGGPTHNFKCPHYMRRTRILENERDNPVGDTPSG
jgi:hypothetical protein